jgi:hypothetical protein
MMIYRYVLGDSDYVVATKWNKEAIAPGLALLRVNKQLSSELTNMIKETKSCRLSFWQEPADRLYVTTRDKDAFELFRRLNVFVHF